MEDTAFSETELNSIMIPSKVSDKESFMQSFKMETSGYSAGGARELCWH
jgi:hypothetical protein